MNASASGRHERATRFTLDTSWQRFGTVVIAGSPLTIFRLTASGSTIVDRIERDERVGGSILTARMSNAGAIHPVPDRDVRRWEDKVTIVTPQLGGTVRMDGRITVDDGSSPPLSGATIRLDHNHGPAGARNTARPLVRTPLVAFVDSDVVVDDGWLRPLLPHFDDPTVGLVAPRARGEAGSSLDMGPDPARVRAGTRVSYVPTAAIVARVAALDDVGWFDEGLRFGEDVDLVWRLDEAGWSCRYEPAASVWHEPRRGLLASLRQQVDYGTSAAPLAIRHPGRLAPVRSNGWTAAVWTLAGAGRWFSAATIALGSATALPRRLPGVPPRVALRLALVGHLAASRQLAAAVRRTWWPLVAGAALVSRRARWIALTSVAFSPATTLRDLAYGVGVWKGMIEHRTLAPILPAISAWPGRERSTG
ncbi:MAG: glycosyltransferase [Acidimicrobiia bacterium]|nr:glycosyltransferase [Acidimicrobiia bacterium]